MKTPDTKTNAGEFAGHTPGPWKLDDVSQHQANLIEPDYHFIDAGKGFPDEQTKTGFGIQGCMSEADARLIAAAPSLLAERDRLRAEKADLVDALRALVTTGGDLGSERGNLAEKMDCLALRLDDARAILAKVAAEPSA